MTTDIEKFSVPEGMTVNTREALIGYALLVVVLAAGFVLLFAAVDPAAAQGFGKVQTVLDNIKDALTGAIGRTLSIIAVALTGLGWIFGQIDLKRAGGVIVGIGIIFGAAEIVAMMAG